MCFVNINHKPIEQHCVFRTRLTCSTPAPTHPLSFSSICGTLSLSRNALPTDTMYAWTTGKARAKTVKTQRDKQKAYFARRREASAISLCSSNATPHKRPRCECNAMAAIPQPGLWREPRCVDRRKKHRSTGCMHAKSKTLSCNANATFHQRLRSPPVPACMQLNNASMDLSLLTNSAKPIAVARRRPVSRGVTRVEDTRRFTPDAVAAVGTGTDTIPNLLRVNDHNTRSPSIRFYNNGRVQTKWFHVLLSCTVLYLFPRTLASFSWQDVTSAVDRRSVKRSIEVLSDSDDSNDNGDNINAGQGDDSKENQLMFDVGAPTPTPATTTAKPASKRSKRTTAPRATSVATGSVHAFDDADAAPACNHNP